MSELSQTKVAQISQNDSALTSEEIANYLKKVPGWQVVTEEGEARLKRLFKFDNFPQALNFTNRVGKIAEDENHHPALLTEWGKVTVYWWTHKIHGLHPNDFIMASRTSDLYGQGK